MGLSLSDFRTEKLHSVIVYPENTEDVVKIVKIANKYKMPLVPYSGATSLEGHLRGVREQSTYFAVLTNIFGSTPRVAFAST